MRNFAMKTLAAPAALAMIMSIAGTAAGAQDNAAAPAPTARVAQGQLAGRDDGAVTAFLGVPYAAPPVGDNRWRAPQPAASWSGVRAATDYGASCMQEVLPGGRAPWTAEYMVQGRISEDCLTLNVWTPSVNDGAKRPVLVWIHGGGFQEGSGSVPIYRGASLAGRGIVVVSINYRLGLFGFLTHPELTREAGSSPATNFALQDQIAALRWVHDNIAALGGDPANVTIAGQSAGSMAVHSLVASPLAKGLFVRAVAQSGLPSIARMKTLKEAEQNGVAFARDKGAKSLADLRAMSTAQLALPAGTVMGGKYGFGPVIDGKLLPASPGDMVRRGTFNDVPMMIGQTADEGSAFPGYGTGDLAAFNAFADKSFGAKRASFATFYPSGTDAERSASAKEIARDRGMAMIADWSGVRLAKGKSPVWGYYYSHAEPGEGSDKFGAFHSSEIPYVFGTLDMAPDRGFTLADRELSLAMSSYWVNFVKTGNPNSPGLTAWAPLNGAKPNVIEFGTTIRERPLLAPDRLAAYQAYVAAGGTLSMF